MKRILVAIPIILLFILVLPYLAFQNAHGWDVLGFFIIFFFIVFPAVAIFLGILAGTDVKLLWWLPVLSALLVIPSGWLSLESVSFEMLLPTAIYLGISLVAAVPTALIKRAIKLKKQQKNAEQAQNEKN